MFGSTGRKFTWLRLSAILVTCLALGVVAAAGKRKTPPPPTGLPEQIKALATQLYGVMLEDAGPTLSQIQKLVIDHMTEWMANRTPTDVEARRELENVFSLLHYPLEGQPATFADPWKGQMVVGAGYTLGWTAYDRQNVLAVFTSNHGHSRLATVVDPIPRIDIHYEVLPQLAWDDFRFFFYGFRPGKSQPRLSVVLYSFDGQNLKPLWQTQDVYDGKIEFQKDKFIVRYLNEAEYIHAQEQNRNPSRHMATYQLTSTGAQLVDDHEIPF